MSAFTHIRLLRDATGRIVRRDVALPGRNVETRRYVYDSAGRLANVADGPGNLLESYQYDHMGRRLADINPQRFRGERRYTYSLGDRLLQTGGIRFGHDKAGFRSLKIEGDRETRYLYEPSGLLLAVELPDGGRIEYAHDTAGARREKRVDGVLVAAYRWRDPLRLQEFYDGGRWWRLVWDDARPGSAPLGVTDGAASYLLLADQLGTPLALADVDGNIIQTISYDAFGNLLETRADAVRLPIGFAGGLFDADTGLTRFVWREYDADTGRFTSLDPMGAKGGDKDLYGYCVDDPVNRRDAWGLAEQNAQNKQSPYYCWGGQCDENGAISGKYASIDIHKCSEPFLLDNSAPLPNIFNRIFSNDPSTSKEIRIPLGYDLFVDPFRSYYERNRN